MAVSMGGVVLWGRILSGSHTERSRDRKPDRDDENKRSARKPKGLFGAIADGILALSATGISGFLAVATIHDAIGLLAGAAYPAFPLIALAGAAAFYTGRFAYRRYASVIESVKHHSGNTDRNNNAPQMAMRPERTVQPVSAPGPSIRRTRSVTAVKPSPVRPALSTQPKNDPEAERLTIVESLKKATAAYTGDLGAAAQDACKILENLARSSGVDGGPLPASVSVIFNVVTDHLIGGMIPKYGHSGGQANEAATQLLLRTFKNVASAAGSQLEDIQDAHEAALDTAAQVTDGLLENFKPDLVLQMVREQRKLEEAATKMPVPEMAPL